MILLIGFMAIVQSTVTSHLRLFGVNPDLVLLFVIAWGLLSGTQEALFAGLVGGFMLDVLSGAPFGFSTLSLTLVSYLAGVSEINVFRTARLMPYIVVGLATFLYYCIFTFLLQFSGHRVIWWPTLLRVVMPAVLLNVLCMPIVYHLMRWLQSKFGMPRVDWQ